ncbi:biotin/lipoyl-containing protein [Vibrio metschnikovii]
MTEIMVAIGDVVTEEQSLITVEGDKASMEDTRALRWYSERNQNCLW